ncbi:cation/H(+) antiporter 15-like [Phoenix dactylifera]|uniref:Cation/H(+) antiporter 15-like n=1 Tax=Phoenix dactylifera TaxID=42345 RepID=A0A8B8JAY0_PHODC|nr:cation/H(+) antiporter 15-like [Phoenix dactylifera]
MESGTADATILKPPTYQGIYSPVNLSYEGDICDWKRPIKIASDGFLLNDSSLDYAFPVLLLQLLLIAVTSRLVYALLRPLKQPRVVCDIIGGILLGPCFLTRNLEFRARVFPYKSFGQLRALASYGLMFKLFVMNVKMDPSIILRPGKKALSIGLVSILVPFGVQVGLSELLRDNHRIDPKFATGPFLAFIAVSLSTTTYPVLADLLDELGLLNTELGRLAMSSSSVNSAVGWLFLVVFSAIKLSGGESLHAAQSLATCTVLVLLAVFVFRPCMRWIVRMTPRGGRVGGGAVMAILAAVVVSGLFSDLVGATFIFGPIVLGLAVPDGPPLGAQLVEKLDMIVTEMLMPMLFLSGGLITDFSGLADHDGIQVGSSTMWLFLVALIGFVAKLVATLVPAMYYDISPHNALLLGLIMNFRGMIEMVILLNFRSFKILDIGSYTVLIFAIVLMTGIAVPLVKRYYDPLSVNYVVGRCSIEQLKPHAELRILACMHEEGAVPAIISLLDSSWVEGANPLCVYALHLVEQLGSASSSLVAHKNSKDLGDPSKMGHLLNALLHYEHFKKGHVVVHPFTAIAPYKTMHQDICSLALHKSAAIIVLPFIINIKDAADSAADADRAIRCIVPNVLSQAPCSVGILIGKSADRPVVPSPGHFQRHIGVLFWGGPDDREALSYASRMLYRKGVQLTVIRFVLTNDHKDKEAIEKLQSDNMNNEHLRLQEVVAKDMEQTISAIRSTDSQFDLVIVGRRQSSSSLLVQGLAEWSEFPELGVVGDMLASSDFHSFSSVLVVQKHDGSK